MSSASRKLIQASGGAAGAADTGDDDFANVVLLLDGDGTSGDDNNTFTDSSTNGHTLTKNGDIRQGSFSPYGDNWSVHFGYGQTELVCSAISDYNLSSNAFTIEGFFYKSLTTANQALVSSGNYYTGGSNGNWVLRITNGTQIAFATYDGTTSEEYTEFSATTSLNTWHHFALVREGLGTNQVKFYLDGTLAGSMTVSKSLTDGGVNGLYVGGDGSGPNAYFEGYLSNIRILNGTALYTSAFTPPTTPLTAVTNTALLTCQSNNFKDNSTNDNTITISDYEAISPFSPFKDSNARTLATDGGSGYFDGSGDYISTGQGAVAAPGSGDFTIEFWIYPPTATDSNYAGIYSNTNESLNDATGLRISNYQTDATRLILQTAATGIATTATGVVGIRQWNHVAVVRSGTGSNNITIYVNGVSAAQGTSTANFSHADAYVGTNIYSGTHYSYKGYISDLRVVSGTAVYTSAFTPPTSPLTAITNTVFLLNFKDAGIYDYAGLNNIESHGDAQLDTAVKKYGTGSLQFDGTNDYLLVPYDYAADFWDLNSDYTVEFWAYATSLPSYSGLVGLWQTSSAWLIETVGSSMYFYYNGGSNINMGSITTNTWNHWALTREGNTFRTFKDGTLTSTNTITSITTSTAPLIIGAVWEQSVSTGGQYTGYIDDLRITKGIARYTSSFTAPTAELPKF